MSRFFGVIRRLGQILTAVGAVLTSICDLFEACQAA